MKSILKRAVLVSILFFVFSVPFAHGQFFFFQNPLAGKPASEFELKTLKGKTISLSDYRDGENAIIFFWATWCPHCQKAIVELNKSFLRLTESKIKVLFVDVGESKNQVMSFMNKLKIGDLDVFLDEKGEVSEDYMIVGLPTFVFIGKNGKVKTVKHELPNSFDTIFWEKK